ncbi:uncharacterized protein VTP21DRAFT_1705 [Calcarisporiella thermophila]|uniref:uncharacterized protein n=1 Tax=Calcarisporiella thermophila TaxID=911321 RepID=UPI00374217EB
MGRQNLRIARLGLRVDSKILQWAGEPLPMKSSAPSSPSARGRSACRGMLTPASFQPDTDPEVPGNWNFRVASCPTTRSSKQQDAPRYVDTALVSKPLAAAAACRRRFPNHFWSLGDIHHRTELFAPVRVYFISSEWGGCYPFHCSNREA